MRNGKFNTEAEGYAELYHENKKKIGLNLAIVTENIIKKEQAAKAEYNFH